MHQLSRYKCSNLTLHRSSMNSSPAGHQINHFHLLHSLHNTKQRNSFPIGSVCCLSPILPTFSPMRKSSVTNNSPTTSSLLHSGSPRHLNAGRVKDETRNNEDQLLPPTRPFFVGKQSFTARSLSLSLSRSDCGHRGRDGPGVGRRDAGPLLQAAETICRNDHDVGRRCRRGTVLCDTQGGRRVSGKSSEEALKMKKWTITKGMFFGAGDSLSQLPVAYLS